jgi:hypothetical protein
MTYSERVSFVSQQHFEQFCNISSRVETHLAQRLGCAVLRTATRKQLDLKTREIYWLTGKHSPLLLENKILIYKTVQKPVWTYGIELWGCATKSNIAVIQRYQSILLRTITNIPRYVSNQTLHSDLHNQHVRTVFGNGQLLITRPWTRTPTFSWNH